MELRKATLNDLPRIKAVFRDIVSEMYRSGIRIWDEVYPCEFFAEDIENDRLYILCDGDEIVSTFALCKTSGGAEYIEWQDKNAKAVYLYRLAVNVRYRHRGAGRLTVDTAAETAKSLGYEYLRLLVSDKNSPAVSLYENSGFTKGGGVYKEDIVKSTVLYEYGYEIRL